MRWIVIFLAGCSANWTLAPQTIRQGETLLVSVEPGVESVKAPDDLEVVVADRMLTLHAGYQLSGPQQMVVRVDGHEIAVEVEVIPLGWRWSASFSDPAPTAREHGSFIVDAERDLVYLVGGSGYAPQGEPAADAFFGWDLGAHFWTPLVPEGDLPAPAGSRRVAAVPEEKRAYLFGGYQQTVLDELFRFDHSVSPPRFTRLQQIGAPPPRSLHAFAWDAQSGRFVVFGGAGDSQVLGDTWTMTISGDTATWTQLPGPGPTPRYGFFYALSNGVLYVWSGATKLASLKPAPDTWALDVAQGIWTQILDGSEPGAPMGRRNGAFIYDPDAQRLAIFGGTADGATTVPGLSFLDLRRREWATVTLDDQPPLRSSGFGFYDGKRQEAVLGFGNDRSLHRDLAAIGY